jgi:flagellar biogenesis protein FliO
MTTEIIFTVAAVITALGVIFGGVYSTYKIVSRIGQALGTDEKGRTIAERLDRVEHQLWENGGSSLADRVNNIEAHVLKTSAELEIIKSFVLGQNTAPAEKPKTTRTRKKIAS